MTLPSQDTFAGSWRSRFARLHPNMFVGMHAAAGALATIALTWLFLAIADEIPERSALARTDVIVQRWIEAHGTEWGERAFVVVSWFGAPALAALVAGVLLRLAWRRDWFRALALAISTGGAVVLNNVLKMIFHRGRPETATEFITHQSWSFPSGHSMNAMVAYGFLAVLLLDHVTEHRRRLGIVIGAAVLVGAVGFSRVYLGVHYMSDVVGGWLAGAAWLVVCAFGYRFAKANRARTELSRR